MPHAIQRSGGIRKNNTTVYRHTDGSIRVRLHSTDIVIVRRDDADPIGTVTYDCGGWDTMTTARRMYEVAIAWCLPVSPSCAELRRDPAPRVYPLPAAFRFSSIHAGG
jgi:hypothetical protein